MEETSEERSWVQCDRCQQWRNLPGCTKQEYEEVQAMKRWICSMNRWDPLRANCAQPEEVILDTATTTTIVTSVGGSSLLSKGDKDTVFTLNERRRSGSSVLPSVPKSPTSKGRSGRTAARPRVMSKVPQQRMFPRSWEEQVEEKVFQPLSQQHYARGLRHQGVLREKEGVNHSLSVTSAEDQKTSELDSDDNGDQDNHLRIQQKRPVSEDSTSFAKVGNYFENNRSTSSTEEGEFYKFTKNEVLIMDTNQNMNRSDEEGENIHTHTARWGNGIF